MSAATASGAATADTGTVGIRRPEQVLPESAPRPEPAARAWLLAAVAVSGLAWAGLAVGALLGRGPLGAASEPAASEPPPVVLAVAERTVTVWLAADSDALAQLVAATVDLGPSQPGAVYVTHAASVDARPAGPERWTVTVAADLLVAGEGGYRDGGTRWFAVHVAALDGAARAVALPSEVVPPVGRPVIGAPQLKEVTPGPLAETVAAVLRAHLAGDGDARPYLAPGTDIPRIEPGYRTVDLRALARVGDTVWAEVVATDVDGRVSVQHVPVVVRDGSDGPRVVAIGGGGGTGAGEVAGRGG